MVDGKVHATLGEDGRWTVWTLDCWTLDFGSNGLLAAQVASQLNHAHARGLVKGRTGLQRELQELIGKRS